MASTSVDLEMRRHPLGDGAELHRLEEGDQFLGVGLMHREFVRLFLERHLRFQGHQLERDAGILRILDQGLAALVLLDLAGALQQRFDIAILVDQFGGGLDADAAHARHIVGGIAGQGLDLHHLVGRDAEFLQHFGGGDALVLHGVESSTLPSTTSCIRSLSEETMVQRAPASRAMPGIGGDQVVGLIARHLDAGDAEGAGGIAHQGKLRDQVFRRRRAVRLVFLVDLVAEGLFAGVEDHRQMGGRVAAPSCPPAASTACCSSPTPPRRAGRRICGSAAAGRDRRGTDSPSRRSDRDGRPFSGRSMMVPGTVSQHKAPVAIGAFDEMSRRPFPDRRADGPGRRQCRRRRRGWNRLQ